MSVMSWLNEYFCGLQFCQFRARMCLLLVFPSCLASVNIEFLFYRKTKIITRIPRTKTKNNQPKLIAQRFYCLNVTENKKNI